MMRGEMEMGVEMEGDGEEKGLDHVDWDRVVIGNWWLVTSGEGCGLDWTGLDWAG